MPRARVFVEHISSASSPQQVADATTRLFGAFDLAALFGGKTVLVKPNLGGERADGNTDPRVIYGVVRALEPFAARLIVGDGAAIGLDTASVMKQMGLPDMLRGTKAELVDFKGGRYYETALPGARSVKSVLLAEAAAEADAIVSVAKLKTREATGVSLAIKNLKGMLHEYDNLHFHHVNLCDCLADLVAALRPALSVVDAITALDAHGAGSVPLECLIAGEDPVAVDSAAARAIGVDPARIYLGTMNESHIKKARARGVGEMDDIEIVGDLPQVKFASPPADMSDIHIPEGIEIIDGDPCAACIVMLAGVLQKLKPDDARRRKTTVLVGPKAPPPDQTAGRTIIIGNCLHRVQSETNGSVFIIGCPPHATYDVLPVLQA